MSELPRADGFGERLYTASELASALGRSRRWIYEAHEIHALPGLKIGRSLLFTESAVRAWLVAHRVGDWSDAT